MATRDIGRVVQTPAPAPGFIGEGHTAVEVLNPANFLQNDPFIVLMDDRVDLPPGGHAGGAHPHAGFEIATFLVEGELRDRDEGVLRAGDVMWTTAGSGVIHNEDVEAFGKTRRAGTKSLIAGQVGWLADVDASISDELHLLASGRGARVMLYAGERQRVPIVTHGPFVGETRADLMRVSQAYVQGKLPRVSEL